MMSTASVPPFLITVKRLVLWTTILFPLVFLSLSLWFWVQSRIPEWYYWEAELVILLAVEALYITLITVTALSAPLAGFLFVRGKSGVPRRSLSHVLSSLRRVHGRGDRGGGRLWDLDDATAPAKAPCRSVAFARISEKPSIRGSAHPLWTSLFGPVSRFALLPRYQPRHRGRIEPREFLTVTGYRSEVS